MIVFHALPDRTALDLVYRLCQAHVIQATTAQQVKQMHSRLTISVQLVIFVLLVLNSPLSVLMGLIRMRKDKALAKSVQLAISVITQCRFRI